MELPTPKCHAPIKVHLSTRDICVMVVPVHVTHRAPEPILIGLHGSVILLLFSNLYL